MRGMENCAAGNRRWGIKKEIKSICVSHHILHRPSYRKKKDRSKEIQVSSSFLLIPHSSQPSSFRYVYSSSFFSAAASSASRVPSSLISAAAGASATLVSASAPAAGSSGLDSSAAGASSFLASASGATDS